MAELGTHRGTRAAVLGRVREALGRPAEAEATVPLGWAPLRSYDCGTASGQEEIVEKLVERLRDYEAHTRRVPSADLAAAIGEFVAVELRGKPSVRVLVPAGFPKEVLSGVTAYSVDENFSASVLDGFDVVITECTLAIAETGTLVLQNVPGQGRRAVSLVPDTHLCVVRDRDVVLTVPEALRRLQQTATLPTTFVSGPSATADIEMTRIKGVHGPRFLHVLLVD